MLRRSLFAIAAMVALTGASVPTAWPYKAAPARNIVAVTMTTAAIETLDAVNAQVNNSITYLSDQEHYGMDGWVEDPADKKGDCDDYALTKRKRLIELGWPRDALMISYLVIVPTPANGLTENGFHAVLTVLLRDATGALVPVVLDNMWRKTMIARPMIDEFGYRFVIPDVDLSQVPVV